MKHIVDDAACPICHDMNETTDHLILGCNFAQSFWNAIGVQVTAEDTTSKLWAIRRPANIPALHYFTYLLLCCWQLWKHWNEVVFRAATPCLFTLLLSCKEAASLWRCRIPNSERLVPQAWYSSFSL